jgi:hypothetical protein
LRPRLRVSRDPRSPWSLGRCANTVF